MLSPSFSMRSVTVHEWLQHRNCGLGWSINDSDMVNSLLLHPAQLWVQQQYKHQGGMVHVFHLWIRAWQKNTQIKSCKWFTARCTVQTNVHTNKRTFRPATLLGGAHSCSPQWLLTHVGGSGDAHRTHTTSKCGNSFPIPLSCFTVEDRISCDCHWWAPLVKVGHNKPSIQYRPDWPLCLQANEYGRITRSGKFRSNWRCWVDTQTRFGN